MHKTTPSSSATPGSDPLSPSYYFPMIIRITRSASTRTICDFPRSSRKAGNSSTYSAVCCRSPCYQLECIWFTAQPSASAKKGSSFPALGTLGRLRPPGCLLREEQDFSLTNLPLWIRRETVTDSQQVL